MFIRFDLTVLMIESVLLFKVNNIDFLFFLNWLVYWWGSFIWDLMESQISTSCKYCTNDVYKIVGPINHTAPDICFK